MALGVDGCFYLVVIGSIDCCSVACTYLDKYMVRVANILNLECLKRIEGSHMGEQMTDGDVLLKIEKFSFTAHLPAQAVPYFGTTCI